MTPTTKGTSLSKTRSSVSLKKVKGENFYRNAKQVGRLNMLKGGKAVRDKDGKIIQAAAFQKGEDETKPGRVQPDRRWFGMSDLRYIGAYRWTEFQTLYEQEILGSFHKLRLIIFAQVLRRRKMILILFFCGGKSCLWRYWTMLQILI